MSPSRQHNSPVMRNSIREFQSKNLILTLRYGVFNMQGHRKTQEDSHHAEPNMAQAAEKPSETVEYPPQENFAFFGVYDGHGGPRASAYVAEHLHNYMLEERRNTDDLGAALVQGLRRIEVEFLAHSRKIGCVDGTTVAVALVDTRGRLIAACVGDSEMTLARGGKAIALLPVHNPKRNEDECKRIEAAGGRLWHGRVAHPALNPAYFSIAVSRSIGDLMFKEQNYLQGKVSGLTAEPELMQIDLGTEDEFLILACDGLWDVMSHQEAVDFCLPRLRETDDPQTVAQQLTQKAFDSGSLDNITVMIVTFRRWQGGSTPQTPAAHSMTTSAPTPPVPEPTAPQESQAPKNPATVKHEHEHEHEHAKSAPQEAPAAPQESQAPKNPAE